MKPFFDLKVGMPHRTFIAPPQQGQVKHPRNIRAAKHEPTKWVVKKHVIPINGTAAYYMPLRNQRDRHVVEQKGHN